MSDIKELTKRIIEFRDARDWKQFHNPKDVVLSLMLEVGELAEHFQWKNEREIKEYLKEHKPEVADELADVLYWVLLLSHDFGMNLKDSLNKKMKKNEAKYPIEKAKGKHNKYNQF